MKLEKWALIAEIVGSFAVVVTLVLLIVEVRGTTNAIQEQTIDAQRYAEYERRRRLIENTGGITDLIVRSWDDEPLTRTENFRLSMHYNDALDNFEWQFGKVQAGSLPIQQLNTAVLRSMLLTEPGMARVFERTKLDRDPAFVSFVEDELLIE